MTVKTSIYEQNLYEKIQKYDVWYKKTNGGFVVDCNSIILYNKIGGFVVDRKSIDLLTTFIRKASKMRLA